MRRLLTVLLLACLTGCATIPTAGPVEEVSVSVAPTQEAGADIAPEPPAQGADADEIIGGFLVAMAAGQSGFGTARSYLTTEAAANWSPEEADVAIYSGTTMTSESGQIEISIVGELDPVGRYQPADGAARFDLALVEEGGELRVSAPPPGLLVSEYMFGRYFQSFPVYFLSSEQKLAPELIYLAPGRVSYLEVLKSLTAGPSGWFGPAVTSELPQAPPTAVEVDGAGVVVVDFDSGVSRLGDEARRRLGAQLLWTMTSFPRVTGLRVTQDGVPIAIPGQDAAGVLDLASQQGWQVLSGAQSTEIYALAAGRLGRTSDQGGFLAVSGELGAASADITQVGLSQDGSSALAILAGGKVWFGQTEGAGSSIPVAVTKPSNPQVLLDSGWLSGMSQGGAPAMARIDSNNDVQVVELPDLPGEIVSFSVNPSGTRVAVVTEDEGGRQLGMLLVEDATHDLTIGDWVPVQARGASAGAQVVDVGWSGEATLIVIVQESNGNSLAYTLTYDGAQAIELGPTGGFSLSELSVQPRKSGLTALVKVDTGQFLQFDTEDRWRLITATGIDSPLFAG